MDPNQPAPGTIEAHLARFAPGGFFCPCCRSMNWREVQPERKQPVIPVADPTTGTLVSEHYQPITILKCLNCGKMEFFDLVNK